MYHPSRKISRRFALNVLWRSIIYAPQHGTPIEVIDVGETALDEDTFDEYLTEIKEHYTADKVNL